MDNVDTLVETGCLPRWLIGFLVPVLFAIVGTYFIVNEPVTFHGLSMDLRLVGVEADLLGGCWLAAAAFFFARYGVSQRFTVIRGLSRVVQVAALVAFIACAAILAVHILTR